MHTPARQQTISKIANLTGFACFKSLARRGWSRCELFLQPFNDIHLVGSEGGVGAELQRLESFHTALATQSFLNLFLCRLFSA